ncbi:hypothetical protein KVR01_005898 [Diaporthe batatas]|uniref:uncharacterized protein n=1 Tax=Diaporthe batatas TaxID=748121 RepID=UPI001D05150E|nr:uncharacterized protein KVR01_005898 [Diaporthe batatas]KAG8163980.1 hypothetical protein KVR01_005898 [Diaporthe batatas]
MQTALKANHSHPPAVRPSVGGPTTATHPLAPAHSPGNAAALDSQQDGACDPNLTYGQTYQLPDEITVEFVDGLNLQEVLGGHDGQNPQDQGQVTGQPLPNQLIDPPLQQGGAYYPNPDYPLMSREDQLLDQQFAQFVQEEDRREGYDQTPQDQGQVTDQVSEDLIDPEILRDWKKTTQSQDQVTGQPLSNDPALQQDGACDLNPDHPQLTEQQFADFYQKYRLEGYDQAPQNQGQVTEQPLPNQPNDPAPQQDGAADPNLTNDETYQPQGQVMEGVPDGVDHAKFLRGVNWAETLYGRRP